MKSYMSVREMSNQWDESESRVHKRQAGHISGPERFGCSWAIPPDAVRPGDQRRIRKRKNRVSRKARRTFTYDDES